MHGSIGRHDIATLLHWPAGRKRTASQVWRNLHFLATVQSPSEFPTVCWYWSSGTTCCASISMIHHDTSKIMEKQFTLGPPRTHDLDLATNNWYIIWLRHVKIKKNSVLIAMKLPLLCNHPWHHCNLPNKQVHVMYSLFLRWQCPKQCSKVQRIYVACKASICRPLNCEAHLEHPKYEPQSPGKEKQSEFKHDGSGKIKTHFATILLNILVNIHIAC